MPLVGEGEEENVTSRGGVPYQWHSPPPVAAEPVRSTRPWPDQSWARLHIIFITIKIFIAKLNELWVGQNNY